MPTFFFTGSVLFLALTIALLIASLVAPPAIPLFFAAIGALGASLLSSLGGIASLVWGKNQSSSLEKANASSLSESSPSQQQFHAPHVQQPAQNLPAPNNKNSATPLSSQQTHTSIKNIRSSSPRVL